MHHIRPYKLFQALEPPPSDRIVRTTLPYHRGGGSVTLLEMNLIMAASRIVVPNQVFEFGTFLGNTTLNLALNIPDSGTIFTLDMDEQQARQAVQDAADAPLTEIHLASKSSLEFVGSSVESKIKMLTGNSTTFDFSPWYESVELVFIDGGHDYATVQSDTENAFRMARRDKPSCVLWHDYLNRNYSGLSYYLDELSRLQQLVHIDDTMLCAWFNDPNNCIWPRLLGNE
jgi:hypothetical protein